MPRPKAVAENATPVQVLDTAYATFKKTPSLTNWSAVELCANAYRKDYLAMLETPVAPAKAKKEEV